MKEIFYSPYPYIILEILVIAVLLYVVLKWSKQYREWCRKNEEKEVTLKEKRLEDSLANPMKE